MVNFDFDNATILRINCNNLKHRKTIENAYTRMRKNKNLNYTTDTNEIEQLPPSIKIIYIYTKSNA